MTVVGCCSFGYGLTVWYLWRRVFDVYLASGDNLVAEDFEMQFTLSLYNGLFQFFGVFYKQCRVFVFCFVEQFAEFFLVGLVDGLYGSTVTWFWEYHR